MLTSVNLELIEELSGVLGSDIILSGFIATSTLITSFYMMSIGRNLQSGFQRCKGFDCRGLENCRRIRTSARRRPFAHRKTSLWQQARENFLSLPEPVQLSIVAGTTTISACLTAKLSEIFEKDMAEYNKYRRPGDPTYIESILHGSNGDGGGNITVNNTTYNIGNDALGTTDHNILPDEPNNNGSFWERLWSKLPWSSSCLDSCDESCSSISEVDSDLDQLGSWYSNNSNSIVESNVGTHLLK